MGIITIASNKGGTGKTLITTEMAYLLSEDGPSCIIDIDPSAKVHVPILNFLDWNHKINIFGEEKRPHLGLYMHSVDAYYKLKNDHIKAINLLEKDIEEAKKNSAKEEVSEFEELLRKREKSLIDMERIKPCLEDYVMPTQKENFKIIRGPDIESKDEKKFVERYNLSKEPQEHINYFFDDIKKNLTKHYKYIILDAPAGKDKIVIDAMNIATKYRIIVMENKAASLKDARELAEIFVDRKLNDLFNDERYIKKAISKINNGKFSYDTYLKLIDHYKKISSELTQLKTVKEDKIGEIKIKEIEKEKEKEKDRIISFLKDIPEIKETTKIWALPNKVNPGDTNLAEDYYWNLKEAVEKRGGNIYTPGKNGGIIYFEESKKFKKAEENYVVYCSLKWPLWGNGLKNQLKKDVEYIKSGSTIEGKF